MEFQGGFFNLTCGTIAMVHGIPIMGHLLIVLYNVALIEGLVIAVYLFLQRKSFPFAFLGDLSHKLFLINGFVLIGLVKYYLKQNLARTAASEKLWQWLLPGEFLVGFVILALLAHRFLRVSFKLLNRTPPPLLLRVLGGVLWIATLFYGMAVAVYFLNGSNEPIYAGRRSTTILALLVIIGALVHLAAAGHRLSASATSRIALSYAYPFLFIVSGILLQVLWQHSYDLHILALLIILANTFVFVWFRRVFLKHIGSAAEMIDSAALLHASAKYQLSKREGEILELLLQGKENREIEDLLFISISTVKNHVHHIFKKMGVRSRAQLFKRIKSGR